MNSYQTTPERRGSNGRGAVVNRHDRRRAARFHRRQTGYRDRLIAGMHTDGKPTTGIHNALIEHDQWCDVFRGRGCNCVPNISISGPDGVVIVDKHGVARKAAKS